MNQQTWQFATGIDLSGLNRAGNVIFTGAVNAQRNYVPVDIRIGHWTSPQLAQQMDQVDALWQPEIILVENNGYQQAFQQWVQTDRVQHPWWSRIKPFTTGQNKNSIILGLPSLEVEFHNRAWRIPEAEFASHGNHCTRGHDGKPCPWCRWKEEMTNYPHTTMNDTVMATWFFREACRMLARNYSYTPGIKRSGLTQTRYY